MHQRCGILFPASILHFRPWPSGKQQPLLHQARALISVHGHVFLPPLPRGVCYGSFPCSDPFSGCCLPSLISWPLAGCACLPLLSPHPAAPSRPILNCPEELGQSDYLRCSLSSSWAMFRQRRDMFLITPITKTSQLTEPL